MKLIILFLTTFSDDLLNYEIGDIDDHELVNEDELLLSDDGKFALLIFR